jgi:protoporphyrinogen oxidase
LRNSGKRVRLIEASERVGGLTSTDERDGFRFDHTGHLLHLRDESIKKWVVDELFRGDIQRIGRISRVWSQGVYTRYPFQANTYGLPQKVADECIKGYLKVLESPPKKKIKTAEDFIYHHFGRGFAKHFMIPYNTKIWGVHPRRMTAAWGERFVPVPKKEDVLAGTKPDSTRELGYNASFLYPKNGMGELSEKIYDALSAYTKAEFGVTLVSLDAKKKIATLSTGEKVQYAHLISTAPLKELMLRIKGLPSGVRSNIKKLHSKSLWYLNVGLNTKTPQSYHWVYVPSPKVPFYRVGVYSNLSDALAPKNCSSLYVELADRAFSPKILPRVVKGLIDMKLIKSKKDIRFVSPQFVKYAYVIYDKNYAKTVPALHDYLAKHDIQSIGRYGAWHYSSMEDALLMGRTASAKV